MGRSKESFHGFFIQCIGVGLIIKPGAFSRYFQVGKPFVTAVFARLIFRNSLVGARYPFPGIPDICQEKYVLRFFGPGRSEKDGWENDLLLLFFRGEKEKTGTMAVIFCDQAPANPDGQRSSS